MIQITVFLEILISCFRRLEVIWFISGRSSQTGHLETAALRGGELKGSPPGWSKGMPNVSSTGLKANDSVRAERNAENYGLDEEMLRATE